MTTAPAPLERGDETTAASGSHAGMLRVGDSPSFREYLADMWARRDYAFWAPLGNLEAQQRDSVLGNLWHVLNPLLLMAVYWLVFGGILRSTRGLEGTSYVAFLAAGMLPFQYTQKSFLGGASSIVRNVGILRSIVFPRALLPISAFMAETIAFGPSLLVLFTIVILTGEPITPQWLAVLAVLPLQAMFNMGGALFSARVASAFRDFENLLPFVFRLLIYLSGIFFLVEGYTSNEVLLFLFDLNPIYAIVSIYRWALLDLEVSTVAVVSAVVWSVGMLVFGMAFFRRGEATYGR